MTTKVNSTLPSPEAKATVISHLETAAKTDLFLLESRLNRLKRSADSSKVRARLNSHTSGSCTQEILRNAKNKDTLLNSYSKSYQCQSLDDLAEILHVRCALRDVVVEKILELETVLLSTQKKMKRKR